MALGMLMIVFIALFIIAGLIQILLYRHGKKTKNGIFIANMILGVILSYLAFSALPTNFTGQRVVAIVWGALAVVALVLKLSNRFIMVSKILLTVAIVGSLVQLFS